jgi:hypothetical protein
MQKDLVVVLQALSVQPLQPPLRAQQVRQPVAARIEVTVADCLAGIGDGEGRAVGVLGGLLACVHRLVYFCSRGGPCMATAHSARVGTSKAGDCSGAHAEHANREAVTDVGAGCSLFGVLLAGRWC